MHQSDNHQTNTSFDTFSFAQPVLKATNALGFRYCTPIQAQALPFALQGHDIVGQAQTGTGKTAAFLLTLISFILERRKENKRYLGEPFALVVAPTRELALQIAYDAGQLTQYVHIKSAVVIGGESISEQEEKITSQPIDLLIATPGRLLDFISRRKINLSLAQWLVIDEADRMLDMGFIPQLRRIITRMPPTSHRQTMMFSATYPDAVKRLTISWTAKNAIIIDATGERLDPSSVVQKIYVLPSAKKYSALCHILNQPATQRTLIFANRRDTVKQLGKQLRQDGVHCSVLSGEIAQKQREKTLRAFKTGKLEAMVATDLAGRGLHITGVSHVINFNLPEDPEDYIHRIGRTGRAGANGMSISFACEEEAVKLLPIQKMLGRDLQCIHLHDDFSNLS